MSITKTELEELALYVNGQLPEAARAKWADRLATDAEAKSQHDFYEALAAEVKTRVPPTAPDLGLAKVLARIEADAKEAAHAKQMTEAKNKVTGFFSKWFNLSPSRGVYAFALALIALQMGVIGGLVFKDETLYSDTRATKGGPVVAGPFIKVSFKPGSKEEDLRFLLVGLGASIVGGPSQLGDYYLYLPVARTDWAAAQLKQSPIIDNVTVMATLPAAQD